MSAFEDKAFPVSIGFPDESAFPLRGTVNFVSNQIDSATGALAVRATLENPRPSGGTRLLSPGMYVRVRMSVGKPHAAILVSDRAVVQSADVWYVRLRPPRRSPPHLWVLDANNTVEFRRVEIGVLEEDGLREIRSGLKPNERVIVDLAPRVQTNMKFRPILVPMPTLVPAKPPATSK